LTWLTHEQLETLLVEIEDGVKLRILNLAENNLSTVEPSLLASLAHLETIDLHYTGLNKEQLETLFKAIKEGNTLKNLNLIENDLAPVEPALMNAFTKLETLELRYTNITHDQLKVFFEAIGEQTHLKCLDLGGNDLNLIEPALITRVNDLHTVNFCETGLNKDQLESLFKAMTRGTQLKSLNLEGNDLFTVEAGLLTVINFLQFVNLCYTDLTGLHLDVLFRVMGEGTKLKRLDLSDLSSVDPTLLEAVKSIVQVTQ
jgi:Leucine-rich repeat (LRR) protein